MSDDLLDNYKTNYFINFDVFFANNDLFLSILFSAYKYKLHGMVMDSITHEWNSRPDKWRVRPDNVYSFSDIIGIQKMPPGALPIYDKDPDIAGLVVT